MKKLTHQRKYILSRYENFKLYHVDNAQKGYVFMTDDIGLAYQELAKATVEHGELFPDGEVKWTQNQKINGSINVFTIKDLIMGDKLITIYFGNRKIMNKHVALWLDNEWKKCGIYDFLQEEL